MLRTVARKRQAVPRRLRGARAGRQPARRVCNCARPRGRSAVVAKALAANPRECRAGSSLLRTGGNCRMSTSRHPANPTRYSGRKPRSSCAGGAFATAAALDFSAGLATSACTPGISATPSGVAVSAGGSTAAIAGLGSDTVASAAGIGNSLVLLVRRPQGIVVENQIVGEIHLGRRGWDGSRHDHGRR